MKNKSPIKFLGLLCIVLVFAYFAFRIGLRLYITSHFSPLEAKTIDISPVHVRIRNQDFWIPANYFLAGYSEQSKREQTALLEAYWPDMTGATKETVKSSKGQVGHQNTIGILLNGNHNNGDSPDFYRLYSLKVGRKSKKEDFVYKNMHDGLHLFQNEASKTDWVFDDIYVDDLKIPRTYITCQNEFTNYKVASPGCQQSFYYKAISFKVSYSKKYQPQWAQIQNKVRKMFDDFSKPQQGEK